MIVVFKLLRCLTSIASVDTWIMTPLLIASLLLISFGILHDSWWQAASGGFVFTVFIAAVRWTKIFPEVPDALDVDYVDIRGVYPLAPMMVERDELVCNRGSWFLDQQGRRLLLRGVNLSGSSKMPTSPDGSTWNPKGLNEWKTASFLDRPLKLSEADVHLGRLRCWGFNFLRLVVTWEAVEHFGPGVYDTEYLHYLTAVVRKCKEHGMCVFIDMHQDVWSRWTGGDGAPAWTLEMAGFKLSELDDCGAALTQQNFGPNYPKMVWNSNNFRLAAGTMWTLFFAGNDYAPDLPTIEGLSVQDYLQNHYCNAVGQIAKALAGETNVIGFDVMNEPSNGWIGCKDMTSISDNKFYVGWRIDPWVAIQCGVGCTKEVDYFESFLSYDGKRELNSSGACAWSAGPKSCVWYQNGVWKYNDQGVPEIICKDYFAHHPVTGEPANIEPYVESLWVKVGESIRKHIPDAIIFAEPAIDLTQPNKKEHPEIRDDRIVWAKHWYDGITLMTKKFSKVYGLETVSQTPHFGLKNIENAHGHGIASFKKDMNCPVLIGECGIPFDMRDKYALNSGDFNECTCALNTTMRALEVALVNFTLWNYTPDNCNTWGDMWNDEDLSLFSVDQVGNDAKNLHAGGRSLLAAVRPYAYRTAGIPTHMSFDIYKPHRPFLLRFNHDPVLQTRETIIFVPKYHFPHGIKVTVSDGTYEIDWTNQTLTYTHCNDHDHTVLIEKNMESVNKVVPAYDIV